MWRITDEKRKRILAKAAQGSKAKRKLKSICDRCKGVEMVSYFKGESLCRDCLIGEEEPYYVEGFSMLALLEDQV